MARTSPLALPIAASAAIHGALAAVLIVALAGDPGRRPAERVVVALEDPVLLEEAPPPRATPAPEPAELPPGGPALEEIELPDEGDPRFAADGDVLAVPAAEPSEGVLHLGAGLRGFPRAGRSAKAASAPASAPEPVLVRARPIEEACERPGYPGRERRLRVEGAVDLLVSVAASGDVEDVEVTESSGSAALDRAAAEAVARWRFAPALRDGVPVADRVRLRVLFRLEEPPPPSPGG